MRSFRPALPVSRLFSTAKKYSHVNKWNPLNPKSPLGDVPSKRIRPISYFTTVVFQIRPALYLAVTYWGRERKEREACIQNRLNLLVLHFTQAAAPDIEIWISPAYFSVFILVYACFVFMHCYVIYLSLLQFFLH